MILHAFPATSVFFFSKSNASGKTRPWPSKIAAQGSLEAAKGSGPKVAPAPPGLLCDEKSGMCLCGRRRFIEAAAISSLPRRSSAASDSSSDYEDILNRVHPPKPDWYEELYAKVMATGMKSYESEIAAFKSQIFADLRGKAQKVLEIGIGTGPNLKYYAGDGGMQVYGMDPNRKMEKYAREAALNAGLPPENFEFKQAVGEGVPLPDASVDAVVGTLVLCSVKNVGMTLKEVKRVLRPGGLYIFVEHVAAEEGTILRFIQKVLDPLQQLVSDGCHLTRRTGTNITEAGFSSVDLNTAFLPTAAFVNPQVYGIAYR